MIDTENCTLFTLKLSESFLIRKIEKRFLESLPDSSVDNLLKSLISSHEGYRKFRCGIPIGNLTFQLFAKFYLSALDKFACNLLGIDFYDAPMVCKS